jgi:hypothetical protein
MRRFYEVKIPFEAVVRAFKNTLDLPINKRSDFFTDIRSQFRSKIQECLLEVGFPMRRGIKGPPRLTKSAKINPLSPMKKLAGWKNEIPIELDAKFAAIYGADDYSLRAMNYLDRSACELPSLHPFLEIPEFTLGNFTFDAPNEDCDISVVCDEGIELVGLATEVSNRKRFSYIGLLGVRVDGKLLSEFLKSKVICDHPSELLDEIRIGTLCYPLTYICRNCGVILTCKCFDGTYDVKRDLIRNIPFGSTEDFLVRKIEGISQRDGICALCTGRVPRLFYGHSMYYSTFLQRYLPYHTLFARRRYGRDVFDGEPEYRDLENETRRAFGYMETGQKWLNETFLFRIVSNFLAPSEVIQHYRGKELEGLEIDVWVPSLQLGIEYQGEQHYRSMNHWGGQEGLKRRLSNDQRKRILCAKLGYTLVEFLHDQEVSDESVRKLLDPFIGRN